MKKFDIYKTIQLILFIIITGISIYCVIFTPEIFHAVASERPVRILCILLWVILGLSFLFLFLDFSFFGSFKQDYRDLKFAVHSDPVAGIANRFSCDALIEKYLDKPLPENIGCVMFSLTNIFEINKLYGHIEGNSLIKDFSNILRMASVDLCFVGRNGGNVFLALFEDTTQEKIDIFMARVKSKVDSHNALSDAHPINYSYGVAFHEDASVKTITELIALSSSRIPKDN